MWFYFWFWYVKKCMFKYILNKLKNNHLSLKSPQKMKIKQNILYTQKRRRRRPKANKGDKCVREREWERERLKELSSWDKRKFKITDSWGREFYHTVGTYQCSAGGTSTGIPDRAVFSLSESSGSPRLPPRTWK